MFTHYRSIRNIRRFDACFCNKSNACFGPLCFDLRRGLINALGLISFDIMIVYTKSILDDQER